MFGNMMEKLQQMQQKMEESKKRLDNITVEGEAGSGAVKVEFTGNRKLKSIVIQHALLNPESKEELEDLIAVAVNRGLEQAERVWEAEMKNSASGMLPGIGF
jgi:DNA-binding YbaB/EbfC family protein